MRPGLVLLPLLAACAPPPDAPDLSLSVAANRPWPRLRPLDDLLAAPESRIADGQEAADAARAARLRARAEALAAPALSAQDRARIEAAGTRETGG